MKNRTFKSLFTAAVAVVTVFGMSLTSLAATYTTTTRYMTADTIRITSVASNVAEGEYVTHYVTDSEGNIVYLNQETGAKENDTITFQYTTSATNISSQMKFGGVSDTASNKGDEGYDELGFNIAVNVDGVYAGTVVVPEQEAGILLSRKINLEGIYDFSAAIVSVAFDGTEIENIAVGDSYIVLYTSAITADGTLDITTDSTQISEFKVKYGTLTYGSPVLSMLAKVTAKDGAVYGFVISDKEEITAEDVLSSINASDLEGTLASGEVLNFRAFGKGSTGNYGVEVQGIDDYLSAGTYYVSAYVISGGECKVNAVAGKGTREFTVVK